MPERLGWSCVAVPGKGDREAEMVVVTVKVGVLEGERVCPPVPLGLTLPVPEKVLLTLTVPEAEAGAMVTVTVMEVHPVGLGVELGEAMEVEVLHPLAEEVGVNSRGVEVGGLLVGEVEMVVEVVRVGVSVATTDADTEGQEEGLTLLLTESDSVTVKVPDREGEGEALWDRVAVVVAQMVALREGGTEYVSMGVGDPETDEQIVKLGEELGLALGECSTVGDTDTEGEWEKEVSGVEVVDKLGEGVDDAVPLPPVVAVGGALVGVKAVVPVEKGELVALAVYEGEEEADRDCTAVREVRGEEEGVMVEVEHTVVVGVYVGVALPLEVRVVGALTVASAVLVEVPQDVVVARSTEVGDTEPQVVGEGVTTAVGESSAESE